MRRKLSMLAFLYISGIFTLSVHPALFVFSGVLLAGTLLLSEAGRGVGSTKFKAALVLTFLLGAFLFFLQSQAVAAGETLDGHERKWTGKVLEVSQTKSGSTRILCRLEEPFGSTDAQVSDGTARGTSVSAGAEGSGAPSAAARVSDDTGGGRRMTSAPAEAELIGCTIAFTAKLEEPDGRRNPNTFDYRQYLLSRRIGHTAFVKGITVLPVRKLPSDRVKSGILQIREKYLDSLVMPDEEKQLLAGVLFGKTDSMEDEMKEDFRSNGTAHILAVSGLHVGVIYGLYRRLTEGRKRKHDALLLLLFLGLYGCLTLWAVSVIRAVMLITLVVLGDACSRRYDLMTALGFTAMMIAVVNPYAIFGASFQMSFLAVMSIGFFTPLFVRALPANTPSELPAALAVQLGTVPYSAFMFNQVALGALLCNVPVIFLLGILVPAGILAMPVVLLLSCFTGGGVLAGLLGGAAGGLTAFISFLLQLLAKAMLLLNAVLSQEGKFCVNVISLPAAVMLAGYLLLFFYSTEYAQVHRLRGNGKMLAAVAAVLMVPCVMSAVFLHSDFMDADVILVDVGQGDCVHVLGEKEVLLDGGGSVKRNIGKQVLEPYLLKNGRWRLNGVLATHLHTDHYLGLQQLQEVYPVGTVVTQGKAGDVYSLGGDDRIEILWPEFQDPEEEDENMNSLIFKVYINGFTMLVTGDVGEAGEQGMLEMYKGTDRLKCDVLKVGHHGSRYSSTDEFIDAVSPKIAVIGVGKNNTYGHPTSEVLQKFEDRDILVYRTDLDGAIGIRRDEQGIFHISTMVPRVPRD